MLITRTGRVLPLYFPSQEAGISEVRTDANGVLRLSASVPLMSFAHSNDFYDACQPSACGSSWVEQGYQPYCGGGYERTTCSNLMWGAVAIEPSDIVRVMLWEMFADNVTLFSHSAAPRSFWPTEESFYESYDVAAGPSEGRVGAYLTNDPTTGTPRLEVNARELNDVNGLELRIVRRTDIPRCGP